MRALCLTLALCVVAIAAASCSDDGATTSGTGASAGATSAGGNDGGGGDGQGGGVGGTGNGGAGAGAASACLPLPAASGTVIDVTPADAGQLHDIIGAAPSGASVVLADGTYDLSSTIQMHSNDVTIRSASNDASAVVIDAGYNVAEAIAIYASNITISDVTIMRAVDHPIHIQPDGTDLVGTHIYRVRIIDGGEQFIKINANNSAGWTDDGKIECSYFELTDAGRPNVESCCGGCYTGGIDAHESRGWEVRNNTFLNIYCDGAGLAEHAVHFWQGSRDTLVENNTIINCARGIGFGLGGGQGDRVYADNPHGGLILSHYDGIIRNNLIYGDIPYFDTGIELQDTREPLVIHNTVINTNDSYFSSIDYRFPETLVRIHNNLTRRITQRDGALGTVDHNLEDTPTSYFIALPSDMHLTPDASGAIDQGVDLGADMGLDIDGDSHDVAAPDLGADERSP